MVYQWGRQRNISSFMRSFRKQGQKVGKALQNSCSKIRFAKIDACSNCRFFFPSRPFVMNACRWIGCSHFGLLEVWHKKQAALVLAKFAHVLCTRRTSSALLFYPNLSVFQTVLDLCTPHPICLPAPGETPAAWLQSFCDVTGQQLPKCIFTHWWWQYVLQEYCKNCHLVSG